MKHRRSESPEAPKTTATAVCTQRSRRTRRQGWRTAVSVREASPADRDGLRGMLSRVSGETIYARFHLPYPNVLERTLALLMPAEDRDDVQVLLAVSEGEIVGHAMYVRHEEGGDEAEVAIIVEDRWQLRGVGKLLLNKLAEDAWCRGVDVFVGTVLPENRRMLALLDTVFAHPSYKVSYGLYEFRAPLEALDRPEAERRHQSVA